MKGMWELRGGVTKGVGVGVRGKDERGGKGSRREEGLVTGKERDGPASQWDPVKHRPDRAAGKTGHCPDPGLATP